MKKTITRRHDRRRRRRPATNKTLL